MLALSPLSSAPIGGLLPPQQVASGVVAEFSISGSSALDFKSGSRFWIAGSSSFSASGFARRIAVASISGGSNFSASGFARANSVFFVLCSPAISAVSSSPARFQMRCSSKTKADFIGKFEAFSAFNIPAGAVAKFSPRREVEMRMRARSRTIMRWRSGSWPW